jgi:hypothetical protein
MVGITAVQFAINRSKNGPTIENSFNLHNLLFRAFVNSFWPMLIALYVLEKTIGPYLPNPNYQDVMRADSLRSIPNTPAQSNNAGANISNAPDQL